MKEKFSVSGMSCSACSSGIERAVNKLNGVTKAEVSLMGERMVIEYDESVLSRQEICDCVTDLGYGISEYDIRCQKPSSGIVSIYEDIEDPLVITH